MMVYLHKKPGHVALRLQQRLETTLAKTGQGLYIPDAGAVTTAST